jgi:hypothetical protein
MPLDKVWDEDADGLVIVVTIAYRDSYEFNYGTMCSIIEQIVDEDNGNSPHTRLRGPR